MSVASRSTLYFHAGPPTAQVICGTRTADALHRAVEPYLRARCHTVRYRLRASETTAPNSSIQRSELAQFRFDRASRLCNDQLGVIFDKIDPNLFNSNPARIHFAGSPRTNMHALTDATASSAVSNNARSYYNDAGRYTKQLSRSDNARRLLRSRTSTLVGADFRRQW